MTGPAEAPTGNRSEGASVLAFVAVCAVAIGASGAALALLFGGAAGHRAVAASAGVAFVVQLVTYTLARRAARRPGRPIIAAWVGGMLLRFGAVVAYAMVAVRGGSLAPVPALISLVIFFFVTTLLEPWLLQS